jgi:hypothetical protein
MELVLPPHSAFYTTYENFFPAFLMAGQKTEERKIGGRGVMAMNKKVYGFFNDLDSITTYESFDLILPEQTTFSLLDGYYKFMLKKTFSQDVAPKEVQLQVEVNDQPMVAFDQDTPTELSLEDVTSTLDVVMDQVRKKMNVSVPLLRVHNSPDGSVSLCNHQVERVPDYGVATHVTISQEMSDLMQLPLNMVFPMDTVKYYRMKVRSRLTDPFVGLYPILLVAREISGATRSFVEGLGDVPVLGMLRQGGQLPVSQGLTFENDRTRLTVEFYDKSFRQIVFDNDYEFLLMLLFNDPNSNLPQVLGPRTWK